MPNLDVPRWIINKYATTMKHIFSSSASLWIIQTDRESGLKVIHRNLLTRNQFFFLSSISLDLSLTTVWVLLGGWLAFPNWQDAKLTLSQLATALGFFTGNRPFLARKHTWLNPIWTRRKCHCSRSLWDAFRFLLCFLVSQMSASRTNAVHFWTWGS